MSMIYDDKDMTIYDLNYLISTWFLCGAYYKNVVKWPCVYKVYSK